jgi:Uma2 family endonuclease
MTRAEFHRIYEQMPEDFKAELVGGIVYVASPLRRPHGTYHVDIDTLAGVYQAHTPGVEAGDNTTILLGEEGEPQPDVYLRILPEYCGQTRDTEDGYIEGAPELIVEVAHSSKALDLHGKLADYRQYGVQEYLVLCVRERELRWFDLPSGKELHMDREGIMRIRTFPGLWIDVEALLARNGARYLKTLQQGLASTEHERFVKRLERKRKR